MPPAGKVLLDTNIIIALFSGDARVAKKLSTAPEVFVSSISLGELYYGAWKSSQSRANLRRLHEFSAASAILSIDADTAEDYGRLKAALRNKGRMIPENDLWIAAQARQHKLLLISRDSHFDLVEDLHHAAW